MAFPGIAQIEVDPLNAASNALLLALGFVKEGLLRQRRETSGAVNDTNLYGCLSHEWLDRQGDSHAIR